MDENEWPFRAVAGEKLQEMCVQSVTESVSVSEEMSCRITVVSMMWTLTFLKNVKQHVLN